MPLDNPETGELVDETPPTLNSAAGLSAEDLALPPDPSGGSAAGVDAGDGGAGNVAAPADPNIAAAVTQSQSPTVRDAARTLGLDLSQYQDDAAAFAYLVQAAHAGRQNDYYTQLGRQIAPHYQGVSDYLRQQQAQQNQPQERPEWQAPEFDERWLQLVDKDPETGRYVPKPGVNPAFAEKVQAYADHLDNWTTKLARDPENALAGIVQKVAEQLIEGRFGQVAARQEAQTIIQANEGWIYATDQNGRRLQGQDGRFVPTPLGARYYSHLQTLRAAGVNDARTLDTMAKQLLQGEMYAAQYQAGNATRPQTNAAVGRPNVNPGQAVEPQRRGIVPGATEPRTDGLSLQDMLRAAMAEGGVSDADFKNAFS